LWLAEKLHPELSADLQGWYARTGKVLNAKL
jgi:hypothetical protein